MRSAAADPRATGWRRVTRGGCKFCQMLAGRDAVYGAESVRFASHDHCRCQAVPAYGGKPVDVHQYTASKAKITEAERRQLKDYLAGLDDDGQPLDAAASSGRQASPLRSRGPDGAKKPWTRHPDETDEHRLMRQRRLASDMSDLEEHDGLPLEIIHSHEIDFLERFEAQGHRARWIRRSADRTSSNDFIWLDEETEVCELKVTQTKYRSISKHIRDTVIAARDNHGVTKDVYMIDISPFNLSAKLRQQLSEYNQRVQDGQIRRLFVMSEDGQAFEEINLRPRTK